MQRARVIGKAVSTAKHPSMERFRLLVMQPLGPTDKPDGDPLLVVDTIGAAVGSIAIVTNDGRFARQLVGSEQTPVRYTCLGIEDE